MEITNWLQRNRVLRRLSWCFFQQNRPTVWSYCNQGEASSKSLRGSAYPFQIQTYNTTRLLSLEQKKLPDVLWPNLGGTLACFIFLKPVFICFLFFQIFSSWLQCSLWHVRLQSLDLSISQKAADRQLPEHAQAIPKNILEPSPEKVFRNWI